jgi:gluconate kinase
MVIFVCGQVGVGKSELSRALASALSCAYCDTDAIKAGFIAPRHQGVAQTPLSDSARADVSYAIARAFQVESQRHRHIVVDDTLHRSEPRAILFEAARAFFGGYCIVRVQADASVVDQRLAKRRDGHLLSEKNERAIRDAIQAETQPFTEAVLEFENNGPLTGAVERLVALVQPYITPVHSQERF